MPDDSALLRCPACDHLLRVPDEFLGRAVNCSECQALFRAPRRAGDALTQPVLLSRTPAKKATVPALVFIPMFGLLFLGLAGMAVNGYLYLLFGREPQAAADYARKVLDQLADTQPPAKADGGKPTDDEAAAFRDEQQRRIADRAAEWGPYLRPGMGMFFWVSVGEFVGGVAFLLRRFRWLAAAGCVLAVLNFNHACCVPGAIVAGWGLFGLISDDGRRYFVMTTPALSPERGGS